RQPCNRGRPDPFPFGHLHESASPIAASIIANHTAVRVANGFNGLAGKTEKISQGKFSCFPYRLCEPKTADPAPRRLWSVRVEAALGGLVNRKENYHDYDRKTDQATGRQLSGHALRHRHRAEENPPSARR